MEKLIGFKVVNKIVGKGRGRAFIGKKKGGVGPAIRVFTPAETVQKSNYVGFCFIKAAGEGHRLYTGPLRVEIETRHEIPASYSKKRRQACLNGSERPQKKPDIDNIEKLVLDALNKKAWEDDTQVVEIETKKYYIDSDGIPEHMVIRIYALTEAVKTATQDLLQ